MVYVPLITLKRRTERSYTGLLVRRATKTRQRRRAVLALLTFALGTTLGLGRPKGRLALVEYDVVETVPPRRG